MIQCEVVSQASQSLGTMTWLSFFFGGFAGAATVLGLERWLDRRKERRTNEAVLSTFKEELISNLEMLSGNCNELEREIVLLNADGHYLVTALTPYIFPTWDAFKVQLADALLDQEAFRRLSLVMHSALLINGEMASRESMKQLPLTNIVDALKQRDEILLMRNAKLLTSIMELRDSIKLKVVLSSPSKTYMDVAKDFQTKGRVKKSDTKSVERNS